MVASVRHGVLLPDDASRTIHECAALLNLQLASDLPVQTVIITGLRKTAVANDIREVFRQFGDIEDVAVASSQRGFGKSNHQLRNKYRKMDAVLFSHCFVLSQYAQD